VEGGDGGGIDYDAAFAVAVRRLLHHGSGREPDHVEGADEIDANRAGEAVEPVRAFAAHHLLAWRHARAVDQSVEPSEGVERELHGGLSVGLAGHVGGREARGRTEFGGKRLSGVTVYVGDDDASAGSDQA